MSKIQIPENWIETTLGEFCELQYGKNLPTNEMKESGFPVFGANGQIGFYDRYLYEKRKLLMTCRGATCGTINMSLPKSFVTNNSIVISPKVEEENLIDFIRYQLVAADKKAVISGSAQPQVTIDKLKNLPIKLPSVSTAKRIVAKIESTQAKAKTIESSISNAEGLMEKYRESLLQKAFRGELVAQDPNDEPASKLIERIRNERAKQSDGKKKRIEERPHIKPEEIPYEIPKSWEWVRLSELGELARGKSKHRPRNDPKLFGGKYPFIQTGDVAAAKGGVIQSFDQTLSEFGIQQSRLFPKGTLCITIAANIADTGVLGFESAFPDSVVGFSPYAKGELLNLIVQFVQFYIQATKEEIDRKAHGAAQKNINLEFLDNLLIPLPPQRTLALTLQSLASSSENLKNVLATLTVIQQQASLARSAILDRAFVGSLVSQLSSEGTGRQLLEMIKNQTVSQRQVAFEKAKVKSPKQKVKK